MPLGAALCLAPMVSSGMALLLGVLLAISIGNPYLKQTQKITKQLLALSVVGLGAGMNLEVVGRVGLQGVGYTMIGITLTFILGLTLGRLFQTPTNTAWLITTGTAICGGSAIAAVSPIIKAKSQEISVALGVVFLLNALALFIFPPIGHAFHLSQTQFGLWSALAIHDTSSVLGASMQF
ncbi:putative sulfate exporter family transporter, partial [Candidatus Shapirobacteria bacterium CG10_big_fil_rev_8_21_14_0_10_38_8]